jgi:hypothetical protein
MAAIAALSQNEYIISRYILFGTESCICGKLQLALNRFLAPVKPTWIPIRTAILKTHSNRPKLEKFGSFRALKLII